jgi:hypothetical protein
VIVSATIERPIRNQSLYPAELRDRLAFSLRNRGFSCPARRPAAEPFAERNGARRHSAARHGHNFGHTGSAPPPARLADGEGW